VEINSDHDLRWRNFREAV